MAKLLELYTGTEQAKKYHSVSFFICPLMENFNRYLNAIASGRYDGSGYFYNTWDTWHLIPTSRPVVNPPSLKANVIDIPGSDDPLDLSYALTSFPSYGRRSGAISFYAENGFKDWDQLYSELLRTFQGKQVYMALNDDPTYIYTGKMEINSWASNKERSTIVMNYDFSPYKLYLFGSLDDMIWDLFDLEEGYDYSGHYDSTGLSYFNGPFKDIIVNSETEVSIETGKANIIKPVNPTITIKPHASGHSVRVAMTNNENKYSPTVDATFDSGTEAEKSFIDPHYVISGIYPYNTVSFALTGHGYVSIDFRGGRL